MLTVPSKLRTQQTVNPPVHGVANSPSTQHACVQTPVPLLKPTLRVKENLESARPTQYLRRRRLNQNTLAS